MTELETLQARLDEAEAACAAMRRILESKLFVDILHDQIGSTLACMEVDEALRSNAGRGWLSPEKAAQMREALMDAKRILLMALAQELTTREDIDRTARFADAALSASPGGWLEARISEAVEAEREACAQAAEEYNGDGVHSYGWEAQLGSGVRTATDIAAAIRARKTEAAR